MSHNAIETPDEFPATISVPDIGDTTYPDTVGGGLTDLAKRTRHTLSSIAWTFGSTDAATFDSETEDLLTSLPHPLTRLGSLNFFSQIAKPLVGTVKYLSNRVLGLSNTPLKDFSGIAGIGNQFTYAEIGGVGVVAQQDISGDESYHVAIPAPLGGFLRNVTVWALPMTAVTHSALPATKPTISVHTVESQVSGLVATSLGSATDPSASTGAYDVLHSISLTLSRAMTQTLSTGALLGYRLKITGEAGADSIAQGFCIVAVTASYARGGG